MPDDLHIVLQWQGKSYRAKYEERNGTVTVHDPRKGQATTQVGKESPETVAKRLMRRLIEAGRFD